MNYVVTLRVTEYWQRAYVNSIRVDICIRELGIDPETEFDANDNNDTRYVLATKEKLPAGTCRLRFIEKEHVAKIERVNVLKEYRGTGVGHELLDAAENWAAEEGYYDIVITSREEAVSFYEKCGYTAHPEQKYQSDVFVCVPMTKNISVRSCNGKDLSRT